MIARFIQIHAATLSAHRLRIGKLPREAVKVFDARISLPESVTPLGPKFHRSHPVNNDGTHGYLTSTS